MPRVLWGYIAPGGEVQHLTAAPVPSQPPPAAGNRAASTCWHWPSCPLSSSRPSAPASAPSTLGPAGPPRAGPPVPACPRRPAVPGRDDVVSQGVMLGRGCGAGPHFWKCGANVVPGPWLSLRAHRAALLRPDLGGSLAPGWGLHSKPARLLLPHPCPAPAPGQDLRAPLPPPHPQGCSRYPPGLGHPVPAWGPIGSSHASGRGTSSLPWHPHGAPLPLVPPVPFLSPQTWLWQGASPAPPQRDPGDPPPGEAWWAMGQGGLKGLGRWARCPWVLTWLFGDSLSIGILLFLQLGHTRREVGTAPQGAQGQPGPTRGVQGRGGTAQGMGATGPLPELALLCLQAGGRVAAPLLRAL